MFSSFTVSAAVCLMLPTVCVSAERHNAAAVSKTVERLNDSVVQILNSGDRSSGVVISSDGHILTVAHGIDSAKRTTTVFTSDRRKFTADVLHLDDTADVALLKIRIDEDSERPKISALPLHPIDDPSDRSVVRRVVLSAGYPARERGQTDPVWRIGLTEAATPKHLRSGCVLTAGDSGGPIFDTSGRLLGIHHKIGLGTKSNLHLPLHVCCRALRDALNREGISVRVLKLSDAPVTHAFLVPEARVRRVLKERTVSLLTADNVRRALGTRISDSIIVTKLSRLQSGEMLHVVGANNRSASLTLVGTSRKFDLAVLRAEPDGSGLSALQPAEDEPSAAGRGSMVFAAADQGGILTRLQHNEPTGRSSLGCTLTEENGGCVVERVSLNSTARSAKLKPGDQLIRLGETEIRTLDDIGNALTQYEPGDLITFTVRRAETELKPAARLKHSANSMLSRAEYLDGRSGILSLRRTGFDGVLQHDVPLSVDQMGGPLVTSEGLVIGVNIARRARESVLALPLSTVLDVVASVSGN